MNPISWQVCDNDFLTHRTVTVNSFSIEIIRFFVVSVKIKIKNSDKMNYDKTVQIKINLSRLWFVFLFLMGINLSAFVSARSSSYLEINTKSKVKWKQIILVKQLVDANGRPLCPPSMDVFDYPGNRNVPADSGQAGDSPRESAVTGKIFLLPSLLQPRTETSKADARRIPAVVGSGVETPKLLVDTPAGVANDSIINTPETDCPENHNRDRLGRCKLIW